MASSDLTICNLALGKIGARRIIAMDEESNEARVCRLHYAETRDEVLRSHRWNFAVKRETLTLIATEPAFGWKAGFAMPMDCLRVFEVNGWDFSRRESVWEIEGRFVMINEESADIRYIARIEDANLFDSIFIEAFATKLASKIAMPIQGSVQISSEMLGQYEKLVGGKARRTDAFEGRPGRRPAWAGSDLVRSRFQSIPAWWG
jgi:hypothetical protein